MMMRAGGESDNITVLAEATRAKIASGVRNKALAVMELRIAKAKFVLRPLRRALRPASWDSIGSAVSFWERRISVYADTYSYPPLTLGVAILLGSFGHPPGSQKLTTLPPVQIEAD